MLSAISQYVGAAIAVTLFDDVEPQTVGWLRVIGAAVALLAISPGFYRGWTRRQLAGAAIFGIATAVMNLCFYLGIDRIDLGKSVAIEFLGPIAVAAATTRTTRNAVALVLAVAGVVTLGGVELGDNAARRVLHPAVSAMWAPYIVVGFTGRPDAARGGRPRRRAGDRDAGDHARRRARSGPVWTSATAAPAVLRHGRVLERDRLRHRPVRAATDPCAEILGVAGACCPVTALVVGWMALDQRPSALDLVGMLAVLAGVALQERDEIQPCPSPNRADAGPSSGMRDGGSWRESAEAPAHAEPAADHLGDADPASGGGDGRGHDVVSMTSSSVAS